MTYRDPDEPPRQRPDTDPAMPYRDPGDPLRRAEDPMRRTYADPAGRTGWNTGSVVGALVVLALIVAAIAYITNRSGTTTATSGPSATQSAPATTGQGSSGIGGSTPSGAGR
jgi:hypothetical protein